MSKILITTSSFKKIDPTLLLKNKTRRLEFILNPYGRKLTENEVLQLIIEHQPVGLIAGVEPLTEKVLKQGKNLKTIARCGIGMDSVDLHAAKKFGITVTNTPDAPTISVAELTIGLILSLLRKIHMTDAGIRKNKWERPMGNLLNGKVAGLIGCGRIGNYLAKLLSAFGCTVQGYDPNIKENANIVLLDIETVLSSSDIISLHIPYSVDNHHFMNRDNLQRMKRGSYLINASRGGLVDETALQELLVSGYLGGAALDCFEDEPYSGDLKELDNVLLTAHIGSYAIEGRSLQEQQALENLLANL